MRAFFYFLFAVSTISFGSENSAPQSQIVPVSETRQTYLDKATIVERRLADIDLKWNWIVVTPEEDSIAKAQGWYIYMGAQRDQLRIDLVNLKFDQLKNYYQDILDLFGAQDEKLADKMADMKLNRSAISPNYPLIDEYIPSTTTNIELLSKWIVEQPKEYLDFTAYLEKLVLNNF